MDLILDNKDTEKKYQSILSKIKLARNGDIADAMKRGGIIYKMNWGVSLVVLREMAKEFDPDHLLALKLWNKQWRESMILATLLDEPEFVSEEQMDFWTKSFENTEVAEMASTHLWVKTKFAFAKSLEWCRGKKHLVRFTGVHLMGRLAIVEKNALDEMFELFFDELPTLAKDPKLYTVIYRSVLAMGSRSKLMNDQSIELTKTFQLSDSESALKLGGELFDELTFVRSNFE
ncbi:MAG: hypothetical protein HN778_02245 [Prolixibacteraceae bacterium]|jgi:3-methyladenine DNA glycosylase AlkD|nr:hypothetical protein [Prolixibacteraceae bacterium]MBT6764704.1 hypothetical protein [Prolixibacteraceae bacterium]MBT6999761.1 hypothetical protein [Prolixibacteraceae bacterium]MBT7393632.1 hypothetical protein [Prolixibacteraceae bacterium]